MTDATRPDKEVPAKRWINDNESDSDQEIGLVPHNRGYKHILFVDVVVIVVTVFQGMEFTNLEQALTYIIFNSFGHSSTETMGDIRYAVRWRQQVTNPQDISGRNRGKTPSSTNEQVYNDLNQHSPFQLIKEGKKHTVVKRKRRFLEDDGSDEDDPYTMINIEGKWQGSRHDITHDSFPIFFYYIDILSPIETPTDIVQRPALRRILKSNQIDALAGTAMEFIEGEKNFNKVLCRLSSILHQDDPQYLDLDLDSIGKDDVDHLDDSVKKESGESLADTAATNVVRHVKELLLVKVQLS